MDLDVCRINMWLLDLCTFRLELEVAPDNLVINAKDNDTACMANYWPQDNLY